VHYAGFPSSSASCVTSSPRTHPVPVSGLSLFLPYRLCVCDVRARVDACLCAAAGNCLCFVVSAVPSLFLFL
jgi:hypothetical protein